MRSTFEDLRRDAAYGLRLLGRNRGFTIVAALTLALGIGATSAIFSVLNAVVLAPLPFRDPDRLVWAQSVNGEGRTRGIPLDITDSWRKEGKTVTDVAHALMGQANFTVTGPGGAERVLLEQVDFYTLQLLGVPAADRPVVSARRGHRSGKHLPDDRDQLRDVAAYFRRRSRCDRQENARVLRPDGETSSSASCRAGSMSTRRGPTAMAGM